MDFFRLPLTEDPYQVLFLSASPEGSAFPAKVELRFLKAPGKWFLSISDAATGEAYARHIPVICSHEVLNDLLLPFGYLFGGRGLGSLFCLRATDHPSSPDPGPSNLREFSLYWGDHFEL